MYAMLTTLPLFSPLRRERTHGDEHQQQHERPSYRLAWHHHPPFPESCASCEVTGSGRAIDEVDRGRRKQHHAMCSGWVRRAQQTIRRTWHRINSGDLGSGIGRLKFFQRIAVTA
jgi:hypothetical protein